MTGNQPPRSEYRPGDVVNGHVLNADGTRWLPLARDTEPTPRSLSGTRPDSGSGRESDFHQHLPAYAALAVAADIRSAVIRSYVFLGIAVLVGLVAAVSAGRAAAQGGLVWTGGGLLAAGLLYVAFRSNLSAVRASKALTALAPVEPRRSIVPFLLASLAAIAVVAFTGLTVWGSGARSLAIGDCVQDTASGVERVDCSSNVASWRVTGQVTAPSDCPPTSSGDINYVYSNDEYFCISRN